VAKRRILFGHQSVGDGVLAGAEQLAAQDPEAHLRVVPVDRLDQGPAIVHAQIGENGRPLSKIAHFDHLMATAPGQWAEVAFFKLCYADFDAGTDASRLFESYRIASETRSGQHPSVTFVHVTTPLTTVQGGLKGRLKSLGGSARWGELENVKRNRYNELLRDRYAGIEPLFDLARLEAKGDSASFWHDGRRYECLATAFTDDGGHLNATGQINIATELMAFLAALPAAE